MSDVIQLRLEPAGRSIAVPAGASLQDALFAEGVEFPCGGQGRCRGCRVRVLSGSAPLSPEDRAILKPDEWDAGWRLACRLRATDALTLEIAQWESVILEDDSHFDIVPREGSGIAVDLGTTTLVAQKVDRRTGRIVGVRSALNAQARHGADVMSRVEFACRPGGLATLTQIIRNQIAALLSDLLAEPGGNPEDVREVILVGNTVMHHLFCGLPVDALAHHPFTPSNCDEACFPPAQLEWATILPNPETRIWFLPCLGGFVGSDILAGILATGLQHSQRPSALVDLGTNGEIVVGHHGQLWCASTAAGPAFEGARITMGMRAATGAISKVILQDGGLVSHVLGGGPPRGICGSGLVDAVAAGLDLGLIHASGRLHGVASLPILHDIHLFQRDIRQLQLAKGAITAGLRLLARQARTTLETVGTLHLAGAFGNYINRGSARRIGLLPLPPSAVRPAGNTALLGARMALLRPPGQDLTFRDLRARVAHVALNDVPDFMDTYVTEMGFP